jgi:hypothetical protein
MAICFIELTVNRSLFQSQTLARRGGPGIFLEAYKKSQRPKIPSSN